MRKLSFKEDIIYLDMQKLIEKGWDGPHAWQSAKQAADSVESILGPQCSPEFWDWLKTEAGIDPQAACCPICGGVTPPKEHLHCLQQLGEWPAKGTRYNDDV